MDGFTLYIRKIGNGFTVSRQIELEKGYTRDAVWFEPDMAGVETRVGELVRTAEPDAVIAAERGDLEDGMPF